MNADQINEQAMALVSGLRCYSERDAIRILAVTMSLVVSQPAESLGGLSTVAPGYLFRLCTGHKGKIERDQEINAFLHGIDHYVTLGDLHLLLVEQFGKERAPSKSALGRYFKKLEEKRGQSRKQLPKKTMKKRITR